MHGLSTFGPCWVGVGWRAPDSVSLCKGKTGITVTSLMTTLSVNSLIWGTSSYSTNVVSPTLHFQHLKSLYTATQSLQYVRFTLYCIFFHEKLSHGHQHYWTERKCDFIVITMMWGKWFVCLNNETCKEIVYIFPNLFSLGPDEMEILLQFIYGAIMDLPPGANAGYLNCNIFLILRVPQNK